MKSLTTILLVICYCSSSYSQHFDRLTHASEAIIDDLISDTMAVYSGIKGISVGVVKNKSIVYLNSQGKADEEYGIPVTTNTMFRLASVSKMFTAIAALKAVELGDLDLSKDIRDYVPEYPVKPQGTITTDHLLANRSGIQHYGAYDFDARDLYIRDHPFDYDPVAAIDLFKDQNLLFTPGTQYNYSTFGFNLAAAVVERATGIPFEDFTKTHIIDVADMPFFQPANRGNMPYFRQATGYSGNPTFSSKDIGGSHDYTDVSHKLGGGGWICSVRGLTHFIKSFVNDEILNNASLNLMTTANGNNFSYYGANVSTRNGVQVLSHIGEQPWTKTYIILSPISGDGVAIMANNRDAGSSIINLGNAIFDAISNLNIEGDPYSTPIPTATTTPYVMIPANNSIQTTSPILRCATTFFYVDSYEFEYADNASFVNSVTRKVRENLLQLFNLENNTTYFWRMRTVNDFIFGGIVSDWTNTQQFTTNGSSTNSPLPFFEDFEQIHDYCMADREVVKNGPGYAWSFEQEDNIGRARFGRWSITSVNGNGGLTIDGIDSNGSIGLPKYVTLTLDLTNYSTATDLTLAFDYIHHGEKNHNADRVWIRGNENAGWLEIFNWYANGASPGVIKNVTNLDIDALLAANGQTPSSTFQIRFGQQDNSFSHNASNQRGVTFDNISVSCQTTAACQTTLTKTLNTNGQVILNASELDNGSEGCSSLIYTINGQSSITLDCGDIGSANFMLTVEDQHNGTSTCNTQIEIQDNTDPNAQCQNKTIQLNNNGQGSITATDIDNNSSDACGIQSLSLNYTDFNCSNIGDNTVTLTITDNNNNTASCMVNVTVVDLVKPNAQCQNQTIQLDNAGNGSINTAQIDNNSSDACGIQSLSLSQTDFNCSNVGDNDIILTVKDNNNNTANCTTNVTVEDFVKPIAQCQNKTIQLDILGMASIAPAVIGYASSDACGIKSLSLNHTNFNCSNIGGNTVTLTVTDNNDNTANCTAIVTVEDLVKPNAQCQNLSIQLDNAGNGSINTAQIDNNSSDACGIQSLSLNQTDFNCSEIGSNEVTLTVTDNNNNTANCTAIVTVEDFIKPNAQCQNHSIQLDDAGIGSIAPSAIDNGSSDACGIQFLSLNKADFNCSDIGSNIVILTVTDNNNNTANCTATVTVEDFVKPIPKCQNQSIQLDNFGKASIDPIAIDNGSSDACGIQSLSLSKTDFNCSNIGDNTVTLTVTDNNNNTAVCTATVTVESLATLSISDVSKLEGNAGSNSVYVFQLTRSIEGCAVEVDYTTADGTATTGNNDYIAKSGTVSFSASGSNAKSIAIQVVQDVEIELDENFFVNLSNPGIAAQIADGQGEATIQNDDSATISINDVSVDENAGIGTFTVTLNANLSSGFSVDYNTTDNTAQDENEDNDYASANGTLNFAGNAGETQTISIIINNDDKVELDETFKVNLSSLQAGGLNVSILDGEGIASIQNEDSATLSIDDVTQYEGDNGTTDYTFTVSLSGNVDASFSTDWETNDNSATIANNDYASANGTLNFAGNLGESHIITVQVNGDCAVESNEDFFVNLLNLQANGRNVSFAKANGIATINNDDSNPQSNSCPSNSTVNADVSCAYKLLNYTNLANFSGGCGSITKVQFPAPGTTVGLGTNNIMITATDAAGNTAICNFNIEVVDNTPPNAQCKNVNVWIGAGSSVSISPAQIDGGSNDNCGTLDLISATPNSFDCSNLGNNSVTLTVEDGAGFQTTCTASVNVLGVSVECFLDADGDSYGDATQTQVFCLACGTGYVDNSEDCDDSNADLNPNTSEVCDGIDNNCDGNIDEGFDVDGDGFTICQGDCNDNDVNVFPGNTEVCNDNIDNNCDGQIDEGCNPDLDGDGFSVAQGDCNDNDISIFPGALEICDGVDNNCDGNIDEGFDLDYDGFTICNGDCDDGNPAINPGSIEICDGLDNDCNGQVDDGVSDTFIGNVILMTQADVDNFLTCIGTIDGDLIINGIGIIDLSALLDLTTITGNLLISQTSLNSLFGLNNLSSIGGNLNILFNPTLTDCCPIEPLISSGNISGMVFFYGNATGCESQMTVTTVCNAMPLISNPGGNNTTSQTATNFEIHEQFFISEVYPNPATTEINILIGGEFESGIIRMIDMQGKVIKTQTVDVFTFEQKLEVGDLPSGVYLLTIQMGSTLNSKKVIIE